MAAESNSSQPLSIRLQRRVEQSRSSGYDLELHPDESGPVAAQLGRYALEVKRATRICPALVRGWWRQAMTQAAAAYKVPCLAYRGDRADWSFVVPLQEIHRDMPAPTGELDYCATLTLLGWAALVREGTAV